jgi:hypothetical protein
MGGLDGRDGPDAVELGHHEIHEHDIWQQAFGGNDTGLTIVGFADHLDVVEQLEEASEAPSDDSVVVYEQHADAGLDGLAHRVRIAAQVPAPRLRP